MDSMISPISRQRVVHFDLKGAPLSISFFANVLYHIKSWGATGILLEWEDTFPYTGDLTCVGSVENSSGDNLYKKEEVSYILDYAKQLNLEVIQLVQTIGHMEFVLKHNKFRHLRENDLKCSDICASKPEAKTLIQDMISQALAVQPDAKYYHIGADEVQSLGICNDCKLKVAKSPEDECRLYLEHIKSIVQFIKGCRPNMTILMWDDMLRNMDVHILKEYNLGEMVQPVVWNYNVKENFNNRFNPGMWDKYKDIFPAVWAGSAFKGANKPCAIVTDLKIYVSNHEAWILEMNRLSPSINFTGVILTGWSRYDHYATLCELLPTAMNSLANCLRSLTGQMESFTDLYQEDTLPQEQWPGYKMADYAKTVDILRERVFREGIEDFETTYMNSWQLEHGFLNYQHVQQLVNRTQMIQDQFRSMEELIQPTLQSLSGPRTTSEWLHTYIKTRSQLIARTQQQAQAALAPRLDLPPRSG